MLKAALAHRGTAMLDVISPCVTFNDHEGSTKSYAYVKDHDEPLEEVSFVPFFEDISGRLRAGHDAGSDDARRLEAVPEEARGGLRPDRQDHGAAACCTRPRAAASSRPASSTSSRTSDDFLTQLNLVDEPLATLPLERDAARAQEQSLEEIMEGLR